MNLLTLTTLMATLVTFAPLADAIAKLNAKTPIGSALKTVDWAEIPAQLRETAQFSAGVESARVLQAIQDRIKAELNLETEDLGDGKTIGFSRSRFIDKLRTIAREEGLTPADPDIQGTIQDITSIPRLGMIHDIQTAKAEGFARWKADQDEGALQAYPAWEFVRVESRTKEREDWPSRWAEAGGEFYGRRMIAVKDSPVWEQLSIFGTPWPPFDFGSGMGLEEVAWDEAVQLGVIPANGHVAPGGQAFTDRLEASTAGLSEEFQDKLRVFFGDQVEITGGKAKWAGAAEAGNEFDPEQPRDGDGKWTGGKGSGSHVTDSPEFKAWFGDSKVVDKEGKPLVVYHGTSREGHEWKMGDNDVGIHFGSQFTASERLSFLMENGTKQKQGVLKAVFLDIRNPIRLDDSGAGDLLNLKWELKEKLPQFKSQVEAIKTYGTLRGFLQKQGYDGIVYQNPGENGKTDGSDSFVAFSPTQIKSASGNSGKFSRTDPVITNTKPAEVVA